MNITDSPFSIERRSPALDFSDRYVLKYIDNDVFSYDLANLSEMSNYMELDGELFWNEIIWANVNMEIYCKEFMTAAVDFYYTGIKDVLLEVKAYSNLLK